MHVAVAVLRSWRIVHAVRIVAPQSAAHLAHRALEALAKACVGARRTGCRVRFPWRPLSSSASLGTYRLLTLICARRLLNSKSLPIAVQYSFKRVGQYERFGCAV